MGSRFGQGDEVRIPNSWDPRLQKGHHSEAPTISRYSSDMTFHWEPSDAWWYRHNQDRLYRIRLEVPQLTDAIWARLTTENATEDGCVLLGGVSLERVEKQVVDAVSGGEDAFDSLDYAINDVLLGALPKPPIVKLVAEEELQE